MGQDAEVIIKITGDSKDFDSKYAKLVKDYQNKEIDMKITANELEQANQKLKEMNDVNEGIENKLKGINNEIKDYENQIAALIQKNATLNRSIWEEKSLYYANEDKIKSINAKIEAQKRFAGNVTEEQIKQLDLILQQYNAIDKIEGKYEKQKNDLNVMAVKIKEMGNVDIGSKIDKSGHTINQTIKKVGRWALAIFGIRSAYMGIRSIMNGVLSQNEKLSNQMNGIKQSLYGAVTPIIEKIINLIKTLMGYVNAIWRKLFGHDLFKATSKSAQKTASAAKEINKQLAGFDEANVLSSNKSSGGGGGGDTSANIKIPNIKLPDWLDKLLGFIKEHPKLAGIIFGTVAFTLFGLVQLGKALTEKAIAKLIGKAGAGSTAAGASGLLGLLGILVLLATTAYVIWLDYEALKEAVRLYHELNDAIDENNKHNDDNIKKNKEVTETNYDVLRSEEATSEERKRAITNLNTLTKGTYEQATATTKNTVNHIKWTKELLNSASGMDQLYKSGKLTEDEQYEYYKMLMNQLNPALDEATAHAFGFTKENKELKTSFDKLNAKFSTKYQIEMSETGSNKLITAANKVADSFAKIGDKWKTTLDKVAASLNISVSTSKHASGGIVNLPGRGVSLTNHVVGEAGREGIVPIDNESQMALLGSEIAKRVTINLTTINQMNGRTISRELNRINSESSFSTNS